jgi:hypothetical protein
VPRFSGKSFSCQAGADAFSPSGGQEFRLLTWGRSSPAMRCAQSFSKRFARHGSPVVSFIISMKKLRRLRV